MKNLGQMMKQAQQMQAKMAELQAALDQAEVTGQSGGGMVAITTSAKGDPKKETSLMPDLMKKLGVTWTVAFSDKDCFNPDFDIMSIPHMAVIDQKEVVRYDDVEPDALKERIDGLLAAGAQGEK